MKFTVRSAVSSDAGALSALAALTFPMACPPGHTPENIARHIRRVLSIENFEEYSTDPDFALFVANTEDAPVGYSLVDYRPSEDPDVIAHLSHGDSFAELSKLYVHADFHGGGTAHALRDEALQDMRKRGTQMAWLTVNQLNGRANAFYEKSGFIVIAEKKYRVGNVTDDDYLRIRKLH